MATINETVSQITGAASWDRRVAEIRLIPQRHGTAEQPQIYAQIARQLYVPHLAPDFAYIHDSPFYEEPRFHEAYQSAYSLTGGFVDTSEVALIDTLTQDPRTLLIFRTITGLLKNEFASAATVVAEQENLPAITGGKVDSAEKNGTRLTPEQAEVLAKTLDRLMTKSLFGAAAAGLHSKQDKFDTREGWSTVQNLAGNGVPYEKFLHQRHYGGAFGQVTNATGTKKGDLIEDAVEGLFKSNGVPYIRTGAHNQGDIAARFEVTVTPAPDFVVFDKSDTLRALLECKGTNDGGTARDKAMRFRNLRAEAARLGGIALVGVLGGIGWARVNDTLGPVLRDTDGRVFTLETLPEMLTVNPFPELVGLN